MKLIDNAASPYAFKVRATLYEKNVAFETHALRHHAQRQELLEVSPRGEVPALRDGDVVLYDSKIICDYLEETHPTPPLLPKDAAARARCRALELVMDTQIDAIIFVLGILKVFRPQAAEALPEAVTRSVEVLRQHYVNLEAELGARDYFVGDFSRADIALLPHILAAQFMGWPPDDATPRLGAWLGRVAVRPCIQRATQDLVDAFTVAQTDEDPLFSPARIHWRSDRVEWGVRMGLGPWLLDDLEKGGAFFSPVP